MHPTVESLCWSPKSSCEADTCVWGLERAGLPPSQQDALCYAGEAFDKVARLLGLDLNPNGGAALETFAKQGDSNRFKFTRPLRQKANCNFSYAGLKTSVRLAIQAEAPGDASEVNKQVW